MQVSRSLLIGLFCCGVAVLQGAVIDSGNVFTRPYSVSDGTQVTINFASSDGGFALSGTGILGGANLDCIYINLGCPYGATYSIQASFPDASSVAAEASLVINGNPLGVAALGCPNPACPQTHVRLVAQSIVIDGPGMYVVPFSVSGQIQVAQILADPLLLDEQISGSGNLFFIVTDAGSGNFVINPSQTGGSLGLRWQFEPVPEPSFLVPTVLAALWMAAKARSRLTTYK